MCNPVGIQWLKYENVQNKTQNKKKFVKVRKRVSKPTYQAKFKMAAMTELKLSYLQQ